MFGLRGTQKDKVTLLKYAKKDFSLDSELAAQIKDNELVTLEFRCVRLDGYSTIKIGAEERKRGFKLGKSEYQDPCLRMPSKGLYSFNLLNSTEFAIPKTEDVLSERNLIAGIGLHREVRKDKAYDLSPWVKEGYNFV